MANTLKKMLGDLALAQTAPDADPDFLSKLQMVITAKLRQPPQPGGAPTGGPGSMAGPQPGGMGQPPQPLPQPGTLPPGVAGPPVGPGAPLPGGGNMGNMDEIRRMISAGRGQGS